MTLLTGCDSTHYYAPVMDLPTIEQIPKKGAHRVIAGETIYEIAWRYGLDYRYLVKRNQLKSTDNIHVGQIIYLRDNHHFIRTAKIHDKVNKIPLIAIEKSVIITSNKQKSPPVKFNFSPKKWQWPVAHKPYIRNFSSFEKGIDIFGVKGEPIIAAAAGKVVYAGNGLRGYGNLIIIKHNTQYLSAYAHHNMMIVKEGDLVAQGQKIAEMSNTGSTRTMLHFEVRLAGKPVNPLTLLPS